MSVLLSPQYPSPSGYYQHVFGMWWNERFGSYHINVDQNPVSCGCHNELLCNFYYSLFSIKTDFLFIDLSSYITYVTWLTGLMNYESFKVKGWGIWLVEKHQMLFTGIRINTQVLTDCLHYTSFRQTSPAWTNPRAICWYGIVFVAGTEKCSKVSSAVVPKWGNLILSWDM